MATIKILSNEGIDLLGVLLDTVSMFPIGGFPKPKKANSELVIYGLEGGYRARVEGSFDKAGEKGPISKITLVLDGVSILEISEVSKTLQSLNKLTDAGAELFLSNILSKNPTIVGAEGDDMVHAFKGGSFAGAGGNDTFSVTGVASYDGGLGSDTVTYTGKTGVVASLANAAVNQGEAAGDTYVSIENLVSGSGDDTLTGSDDANRLSGGKGKDVLIGGLGADTLDGGADMDFASYEGAASAVDGAGVIASLADPSGNINEAAGDSYIDIEGLIGSNFKDTLIGDDQSNTLMGRRGNDFIKGGLGADTLWGDDPFSTGDDYDSFFFVTIAEGGDKIMDYDKNDFVVISKSGFGLASDFTLTQGETFIAGPGAQATTEHWTFLFDTTTKKLYFDEDGSGSGQAAIVAEFVFDGTSTLTVDDLVLL